MARERPDVHAVGLQVDLTESAYPLQTDQVVVLQESLSQHDDQRGAAGDRTAIVRMLLEQSQRVCQAGGGMKNKVTHLSDSCTRRRGDGFDDLVVAGAAAQITHHPVLDLL